MLKQFPLVQNVMMLNATGWMVFDDHIVDQLDLPAIEDCEAVMRRHQHNGILLLEGGGDIHPSIYGQENRYSAVGTDQSSRDIREQQLYKAARHLGMPILGICRGHQMIAALEGGELYQDIFQETGFRHGGGSIRCEGMLKDWFGTSYSVNSMHHQAVRPDRLPKGSQIIGWARDGIIEAICYPEIRVFTTQWHPEVMGDDVLLQHIVTDFFQMGA